MQHRIKFHRIFLIVILIFLFTSLLHAKEAVRRCSLRKGKIIFIDTFEVGKLQDRWLVGKSDVIKINYDPRNVHSGRRFMEVTAFPW